MPRTRLIPIRSAADFRSRTSETKLREEMIAHSRETFEAGTPVWLYQAYLDLRVVRPEGTPLTHPFEWDDYQVLSQLCRANLPIVKRRLDRLGLVAEMVKHGGEATSLLSAAELLAGDRRTAIGLRHLPKDGLDYLFLFALRRREEAGLRAMQRPMARLRDWVLRDLVTEQTYQAYHKARFMLAEPPVQMELPEARERNGS
jgi:hypothetical protein